MRILHGYKTFSDEEVGGIPRIISQLIRGMPEHDSRLVATHVDNGEPSRHAYVSTVRSIGTLLSMPIAPAYPFTLSRMARCVDIVALHGPFPLNDLAMEFVSRQSFGLVAHWHADVLGRRLAASVLKPIARRMLRRADRIVVAHERMISASPLLAEQRAKCHVIPYGIDTGYWRQLDATDNEAIGRLKVRHSRLVVTVGRLVRYKGHACLIRAARDCDATIALIGDGPLRGELEQLSGELGVAHRVLFLGQLSRKHIKQYLHAAEVFVFPSITAAEAFGIAQLEAMAVGLPVVNTRLPTAVPHIARDGLEGLTVEVDDPTALSNALKALLDDPKTRRIMGAAAQQRAFTCYCAERFVTRVRLLYEEVAAARASH